MSESISRFDYSKLLEKNEVIEYIFSSQITNGLVKYIIWALLFNAFFFWMLYLVKNGTAGCVVNYQQASPEVCVKISKYVIIGINLFLVFLGFSFAVGDEYAISSQRIFTYNGVKVKEIKYSDIYDVKVDKDIFSHVFGGAHIWLEMKNGEKYKMSNITKYDIVSENIKEKIKQ